MDARILDLDGSLTSQPALLDRCRPRIHSLSSWGPRIRLACSFSRFHRFEQAISQSLHADRDERPGLTFYGSGDFHHVSLALVRRLTTPFNLLVLDNHPDWMRGIPFLHCGTWLWHAAQLPLVQRIFHVGGEVDFDNSFRWLAPWPQLREGKIAVLPSIRQFHRWPWSGINNQPLRPASEALLTSQRLEMLLRPYQDDLARWPLYISLDKDVMVAEDAVVNWDSGKLRLAEVCLILQGFYQAARNNIAGMDIVGDWSPVLLQGLFRRLFHWTEHPSLHIEPADTSRQNERTNLAFLEQMLGAFPMAPLAQPMAS